MRVAYYHLLPSTCVNILKHFQKCSATCSNGILSHQCSVSMASAQTMNLTVDNCQCPLTLTEPTSKWMYWVTLRRHSDLFRAATSASYQVIPILNKSLLTVLLQLDRGRPRPPLNLGTSQCNTCRGMRWWSIRITCPSQYFTEGRLHQCHLNLSAT